MTREFIQTKEFSKNGDRLGFVDDDLRRLELEIMKNPKAGTVIKGTGKLRKIRFPFEEKGKRGSVRVCYVDFEVCEIIYLITVYPKSEKENLTQIERNNMKKMIELLELTLKQEA